MKYTKANSLRTQQAISRFGKSARYPVCQAWLGLRALDEFFEELMKEAVQILEAVNDAKQLKEQVQALIKQFRKEGKTKEANQASALLGENDKFLLKEQAYRQAAAKVPPTYKELRGVHVA